MEENKIDIEKIKEFAKTTKPRTRFDAYQKDLLDYLISKVGEDVPPSVLMEIAQFAMIQTQIVVNDEVWKARREFLKEWDRQTRKAKIRPQTEGKND